MRIFCKKKYLKIFHDLYQVNVLYKYWATLILHLDSTRKSWLFSSNLKKENPYIRNTPKHTCFIACFIWLWNLIYTENSRERTESKYPIFYPFITPSRPYKNNHSTKTVTIKIIYNSHNSTCPIWKPQQNKLHVRL